MERIRLFLSYKKTVNSKRMKIIILLLLSVQSFAQMKIVDKKTFAVVGFNAGYSKHLTAGLELGVRTGNVYVSVDQLISLTSNATTPKIFKANLGYNFGSLQPFISYGLHTIGEREKYFSDKPEAFKNGFRIGGGVSFYFKEFPLSITVQRQAKQNNIGLGIYKSL